VVLIGIIAVICGGIEVQWLKVRMFIDYSRLGEFFGIERGVDTR